MGSSAVVERGSGEALYGLLGLALVMRTKSAVVMECGRGEAVLLSARNGIEDPLVPKSGVFLLLENVLGVEGSVMTSLSASSNRLPVRDAPGE